MKTTDKKDGVRQAVVHILDSYLEMNNHRKTPERYAILNAVYGMNGHFTLEELGAVLNEDYKFPVVPRFYYFYNGECFKVHEREISRRLPNDKDLKRKYKTIIGLDSFSWTDNESLVQLLKAITTNN